MALIALYQLKKLGIIKHFPTKKSLDPDGFIGYFWKTIKEGIKQISKSSPQN